MAVSFSAVRLGYEPNVRELNPSVESCPSVKQQLQWCQFFNGITESDFLIPENKGARDWQVLPLKIGQLCEGKKPGQKARMVLVIHSDYGLTVWIIRWGGSQGS